MKITISLWADMIHMAYEEETGELVTDDERKMLEHGFHPASWEITEGWEKP